MGNVERNPFRSTGPRFSRARRAVLLSLVCAGIAVIALRVAAMAAPPPSVDPPRIIPTRQTLFSIPFTLPAAGGADAEPVEVRLFASTDLGQTWGIAGRVEPRQTSFTYRAPRDGEYWFVIRTVDKQGRLKPENGQGPELKVVVDTMPPRLELQPIRNSGGDIALHWLAVDPLLKADTLRIEYQAVGENEWHSVQFEPPRDDPMRSTATGDVAFRAGSSGKIVVRAQIEDRAGNVADSQATIGDGAAAIDGPALGAPNGATRPASVPASTAPFTRPQPGSPKSNERHDLTASRESPFAAPAPNSARPQVGGSATSPALAGSSGAPGWPTDQVSDRPVGDLLTRTLGPSSQTPPNSRPAATFAAETRQPANGSLNTQNQAAPPSAPQASRINPPVADRVAPGPPASPFADAGLPPGERPYMVNSRKFALEYVVESVGPAGVAKIEIWGTRDGGRTWASYGLEPGRQGPVRVSVEAEGLYGFRITVQDGNGLSGKPPKSGDLPELWVGVDLTRPAARLTAVELGSGEHAGELAIRWEASDVLLAARPISLLFAERPTGPWTTIAAGLDNSGFYSWRFDNRVPDRVYIRLEVRDEAGNVGEFQTVEPLSLNVKRPQGHLRSVRPMDDDSARVQMYHFYR